MSRVLHIIDSETPTDILDQLALLASEEHIVLSVGRPPTYTAFSLPVKAIHCPLGIPQLAAWRMRKMAEGRTIIHAWSHRSALAASALASLEHIHAVVTWNCLPARRDLSWLSKMTHRSSVDVTVPTEVAQTILTWMGAEQSQVHVLPPAAGPADPRELESARKRIREALGITDDQRLLVAASGMVRGAGHKYASWVHGIVRQIIDEVLLLMPCDGPNGERVRFFAATTGYNDEVFFPENYPEELTTPVTRRDALAASDVALFLAERDAGLSALVDAMGCGCAIAGSNTPDIAECAPDGTVALLSPVCDPRSGSANVLRLIEDESLAKKLGTAARASAQDRFSVESARQRLEDIYDCVRAR
jgi:hypothetical protein